MHSYSLRLVGYGLLAIGTINLIARGTFTPAWLTTSPGRLEFANSLVSFAPWLLLSLALIFLQGNGSRRSKEPIPLSILHRLLFPLLIGYVLLVPLMIRDMIGFNSSVQGQISGQLSAYRDGSRRVLAEVRPLSTSLAVARVVQRYPSISIAFDPTESADALKRKLAVALANGQARLQTRLDDIRRSRLESLFVRTIASTAVALVTAAALAGLRRQNVAAIKASGHNVGSFFRADLLVDGQRGLGRKAWGGGGGPRHAVFSEEWLTPEEPDPAVESQQIGR